MKNYRKTHRKIINEQDKKWRKTTVGRKCVREWNTRYRIRNGRKNPSPKTLYMREWRKKHPEYKDYMKKYRKKNRKHINELDIKWRHNNPDKVNDWCRRYRIRNRKKKSAQAKAEYYIPLGLECELCPEDDKHRTNLQRHHPDYDYPLIVVTACMECHHFADDTTEEVKLSE